MYIIWGRSYLNYVLNINRKEYGENGGIFSVLTNMRSCLKNGKKVKNKSSCFIYGAEHICLMYTYNFRLRTSNTVDGATTYYVYDGENIIAEISDSGETI